MTDRDKQALREFGEAIARRLGNAIHQAILFGSKARGDDRDDSDADVLIIVNDRVTPELEQNG